MAFDCRVDKEEEGQPYQRSRKTYIHVDINEYIAVTCRHPILQGQELYLLGWSLMDVAKLRILEEVVEACDVSACLLLSEVDLHKTKGQRGEEIRLLLTKYRDRSIQIFSLSYAQREQVE